MCSPASSIPRSWKRNPSSLVRPTNRTRTARPILLSPALPNRGQPPLALSPSGSARVSRQHEPLSPSHRGGALACRRTLSIRAGSAEKDPAHQGATVTVELGTLPGNWTIRAVRIPMPTQQQCNSQAPGTLSETRDCTYARSFGCLPEQLLERLRRGPD